MLVIMGWNSVIAQTLLPLLPQDEEAVRTSHKNVRTDGDRYLFCAGLLRAKPIGEQSDAEASESFLLNAVSVIRACDAIIAKNDKARICVIGSESGFSWSYDGSYAASKVALHRYVETKKLRTAEQQLVCIAPGIVGDAGMTVRRQDKQSLAQREMLHPKGRFLDAVEVARLIHFLLYVDRSYLSGAVIRMNGGEATCR